MSSTQATNGTNVLLTKSLDIPMVEPENYAMIFERGIDPHVDDPEHCHVRILSYLALRSR